MKNLLKLILASVLFFVVSSGYSQAKPRKAELKIISKIEKTTTTSQSSKVQVKSVSKKNTNKAQKLQQTSKAVIDPSKVKKKSKNKTEPKLMSASKKKN